MLFYLLVFCGKKIRDCISSLVCVVYIGIYKVGCNIYAKRCLLNGYNPSNLIYQKVSISHNPSYWIYQNVPIDWKNSYWMKMCLLNEKVPIDWKYAYWKVKRHNCSVFLNVYVSLIYVVMWCNEECSTKSQTFRFYIILVANSCNARRIATKWVSGGKKKKPLLLSWSSKQKLH